jgi:hypothetical protein
MRKAVTSPFQFRSPENGYFIDMASKKRVVLDLNAKVKVIEARENDKMTVKQNTSRLYTNLKSKSHVKQEWLTGNGSMKRKLKKTRNEDINEIVWHWFVSARAK